MTVTIQLKPETEKALKKKAADNKCDLNGYLMKIIEKEVSQPPTLDEILEPFRREVEESGITDEEFDAFVDEIREDVYQEKLERNRG